MPRPGPRPYECVRRAWHSDRHQPIRGSVIQQIFRIVTEAHSSTTRKNREWQEKLPRVVFKAEEIMYSKANSEAEYTDPDTLWERLNDAVNTIIRSDESAEMGQFLQPCIEAALILGCVPVRASRSQRHSNPRSYLSPRFQEPAQAAVAIPDKTNNGGPLSQPPTPSSNQLSMSRSTMANQATSYSQSTCQMAPSTSYRATDTGTRLQPSFPRPMPSMGFESNSLPNLKSVYPLYYGSLFQNVDSQCRFRTSQNSNPENIIIGRPVGWPGVQPACFTSRRALLPDGSAETAADKHEKTTLVDSHGKAAETDCDLSLRLGLSDPCTSVEKSLSRMNGDSGSSRHQETSKYTEPSAKKLEFCFFPSRNTNDLSELHADRLERKDLVLDDNKTFRKRKAQESQELKDGSAQWLPELQPSQFDGKIRWPGW